jgi:hypothetical protein
MVAVCVPDTPPVIGEIISIHIVSVNITYFGELTGTCAVPQFTTKVATC